MATRRKPPGSATGPAPVRRPVTNPLAGQHNGGPQDPTSQHGTPTPDPITGQHGAGPNPPSGPPHGVVTPDPVIPTPPPVTPPAPAVDPAKQSAIDLLQKQFENYGLSSLWGKVLDLVKQGYDASNPDAFMVQLQDTQEYKDRFKGNADRIKNGFSPYTPAEYVANEKQYQALMADANLPKGFYDSTDDFTHFIAHNISPNEVQARVSDATDAMRRTDPAIRQALQDYYGVGPDGIVAHFLDSDKARTVLEQQYAAANFKGLADQFGVGMDKSTAELAAQNGVISMTGGSINDQQARAGLSQVAADHQALGTLNGIYGENLTDAQNAQATFNVGAGAAALDARKKKLASQERAAFSGNAGVSNNSLTQRSASGAI